MSGKELQQSHVLRMIFASMADWDRGLDFEESELEAENIRKNMSAESDEHMKAVNYRKFVVQDMTKEEAALFDMLRKRGINMRHPENVIEEKFDDVALTALVKRTAGLHNGTFAKIALYAGGYGQKIRSRGFEFGRDDMTSSPAKAVSRSSEEIVSLLEKEREKQRRLKEMQRKRAQNRRSAGRNK